MALSNSSTRYGSISKTLHWLIALLLILMLSGSFFLDEIGNPSLKGSVIGAHKLTGLAILALMVLRLLWRFSNPRPDLAPTLPKWQKRCAHLGHYFLYGLAIFMPLSGWIMSTASGHTPRIGSLSLPMPLVHSSEAISNSFWRYHQILAWLLITLIALHIAAALKHHFVDKNSVLTGMLPNKNNLR